MFCKNCGSQIDHPGAFCPFCGSKMDPETFSEKEPAGPRDPFCNPAAPPAPDPQPPRAVASDNSQTLGILALVFAFLMPIVGLILGVIGKRQAKEAGNSSAYNLANAGFILSLVFLILAIVMVVLSIAIAAAAASSQYPYYYLLLP